jgi:hypothetical protein
MWTTEFDWDETAITILDESGVEEDVQVFMYEDVVYIRQWFEELERFSVVQMTPKQFNEMHLAMTHTEGAFIVEYP